LVFQFYVQDIAKVLRFGFALKSSGKSCRFNRYENDYDLQDRLQDIFLKAFSENARMQYDGIKPLEITDYYCCLCPQHMFERLTFDNMFVIL